MITKQDMIKLALELSFAQIDLELSQLYVDDFDDKLEGRLKKLKTDCEFGGSRFNTSELNQVRSILDFLREQKRK